MYDKTMTFSVSDEKEIEIKKTLMLVYDALTKKGYNPVNQIVGYILSEDPTYITNYNNARALIRKLEGLASSHQARQLQRQVYVDRRVKSMNESVYYTIDKLHTAIANRKAVTFKYFEYNVKKEKVFRREGKRYTVSPLGLIWDNENYYLAGYDHRSCEMRHYRVDKMAELAVTCLPLEGADGGFDIASYAQKHFGMFSGREGQVTLRCRNSLVGVVLDRFGRDAILVPDGEEHFTVTVPAVVSPQFLGWVFGLGDGVQILRPDWAAEELKRQLAAVAALYQ